MSGTGRLRLLPRPPPYLACPRLELVRGGGSVWAPPLCNCGEPCDVGQPSAVEQGPVRGHAGQSPTAVPTPAEAVLGFRLVFSAVRARARLCRCFILCGVEVSFSLVMPSAVALTVAQTFRNRCVGDVQAVLRARFMNSIPLVCFLVRLRCARAHLSGGHTRGGRAG